MEPSEGKKDGVAVKEIVRLLEIGLDEEEEGGAMGSREEPVADGKKVAERGAAWEKGVLRRVKERGDKGNKI